MNQRLEHVQVFISVSEKRTIFTGPFFIGQHNNWYTKRFNANKNLPRESAKGDRCIDFFMD